MIFAGQSSGRSRPFLLPSGVSARFLGRPLLADHPHLHSLRHLAQWDPQYVRDPPKTADRRIDDPTLDSADVCPVEAAVGAEAFLRETSPITEFAHDAADGFCFQIGRLDLPLAPLHGQIRWYARSIGAKKTSSNSAIGWAVGRSTASKLSN